MAWSLNQLAEKVGGIVQGDATYQVTAVGTLVAASQSDISFLTNLKYKKHLADTQAGAVIVNSDAAPFVKGNAIVVTDPHVAYAKIAAVIHPPIIPTQAIHPAAWVDPESHCGDNVSIGPQVVIEAGVTLANNVIIGAGCVVQRGSQIAANTQLMANVTVYHGVRIGERVLIHSGAVIGADGFGFANDQGKWIKVPQLGGVQIGNDVEIGANTCIDRGAIEDTIIEEGVKLDNQIQIAHNVTVGAHTVMAGTSGIAGSTEVGKHCIIGGGVAINGHLKIVDKVVFTGMSMVTKSIKKPGVYSSGMPAEPSDKWQRNTIRYRQSEKLFERVKQLESKK